MTFDVPTVESLLGFAFEPGETVRLDFLTGEGGLLSVRVRRAAVGALIDSLGALRDVVDYAAEDGPSETVARLRAQLRVAG